MTKMTHGREFWLQQRLRFAQQGIGRKVIFREIWYLAVIRLSL